MAVKTITAVDFLKRARETRENWRTLLLVVGVKILVIIYDLFKKGFHEVYVVVGEELEESNVLHIPQMFIQRDSVRVEKALSSIVLDAI